MTDDEVQRKRKAPLGDVIDVDSLPTRPPSRRRTADVEVVDLSTSPQQSKPSHSTTESGSKPPQTNRRPRNRADTSEITEAVPTGTAGPSNRRPRGGTSEITPAPPRGAPGSSNRTMVFHAQEQGDLEADELRNPSVGIVELFRRYNHRHFWGKLQGVYVEFSTRMTSCAGTCTFKGKLGGCRIALSEPLLKFRPRSDLLSTLLHEMIHAYLFLTEGIARDGFDGHGPKFLSHAARINAAEQGRVSITPYHTFHDEVDFYRVHHWTCKKCGKLVKRAMNRAPSKHDTWWYRHQATCGGEFEKTKGPPPKEKKWKRPKNFKGVAAVDPNDKNSPKPPPGVMVTRRVEDLLFKKEKKGGEDIPVPNLKREGGPSDVKREGRPSVPFKKEAECPVCNQVVEESRMNKHLDLCLVSTSAPAPASKPAPTLKPAPKAKPASATSPRDTKPKVTKSKAPSKNPERSRPKTPPPVPPGFKIPLSGLLYRERHLNGRGASSGVRVDSKASSSREPGVSTRRDVEIIDDDDADDDDEDEVILLCAPLRSDCPVCGLEVERLLMSEHLETCLISLDNERSTDDTTEGKDELALRANTDDIDHLALGVQKLFGGADALFGTVPVSRRTGYAVRGISLVRQMSSALDPFPITPFTIEPGNAELADSARFLLRNNSCDLEAPAHPGADILLKPATPSRSVVTSPHIATSPPRALNTRTPPRVLKTPDRPTSNVADVIDLDTPTPPRETETPQWWRNRPPTIPAQPSPKRPRVESTPKPGAAVKVRGNQPTRSSTPRFFTLKPATQPCPVCSEPIPRAQLSAHVNACLDESGIGLQIDKETSPVAPARPQQPAPGRTSRPPARQPPWPTSGRPNMHSTPKTNPNTSTPRFNARQSAPQAYNSAPRNAVRNSSPQVPATASRTTNRNPIPNRTPTVNLIPCPICDRPMRREELNAHTPSCLIASGLDF